MDKPKEYPKLVRGNKMRNKLYGEIGTVVDSDGSHVRLIFGEPPRQRYLRGHIEVIFNSYDLIVEDS